MTAAYIANALHGRRSERGWIAYCPVHEADGKRHKPSLSVCERDGRVLVHCFTGCAQADVIEALRARALWPERERTDWTPQQRTDWALQQRALERDLPTARLWRRAAVEMGDGILESLKAALFDPMLPWPEMGEIHAWTMRLARWRRMDGAELVSEYHGWLRELPGWTSAMVRSARAIEAAERRALLRYVRETDPQRRAA